MCKSGGVSFKDRESAYPFQISKMKFMLSFLFLNFQLTRGKNGTIFQQSVMLEGAFRGELAKHQVEEDLFNLSDSFYLQNFSGEGAMHVCVKCILI